MESRHIFLLSGQDKAYVDIFTHSGVRGINLDPFSVTLKSVLPQAVAHFGMLSSVKCLIVGYNAEATSADAFSAFPVQVNHREIEEYRTVSFHKSSEQGSLYKSAILVISAKDGTKVDLITTQNAVGHISSTQGQIYYFIKGDHLSITIDKYESLSISSVLDLTGTSIKASYPVIVYSGHECASVPSYSSSCDHLVEQIPPVNVLGTCYIAAAFAGRASGDYIRAVAVKSETYFNVTCTVNGEVSYSEHLGPYSDGEFLEFYVSMDWYCTLESNKPAMVVQFSGSNQGEVYGDPFMIVLSDVYQLMNELSFYSIDISEANFTHFINVVIHKDFFNASAIFIDSETLSSYEYLTEEVQFEKCGSFVVIRLAVMPGYHFLRHSSPEAGMGLTVYGYAVDTSYGYSLGYNQGE